MNTEQRVCWSCIKYQAFYTKGKCQFNKKDVGYCKQHKKVVEQCGNCEQWVYGLVSIRYREYKISEQLIQIMDKLKTIEQAMQDCVNINEL